MIKYSPTLKLKSKTKLPIWHSYHAISLLYTSVGIRALGVSGLYVTLIAFVFIIIIIIIIIYCS